MNKEKSDLLNNRKKGKDTYIDVSGIEAIGIKLWGGKISNLETKKQIEDAKLEEKVWITLKPY